MVFKPPPWVPELPAVPDSISISDFMLDEQYGRRRLSDSRDPFTCGLTGASYTFSQVKQRINDLAKGLSKELGWQVTGSEFDKVVGIYTFNALDLMTLNWTIHRLGAISSPANAQYSVEELAHQLKDSGAKCLFTCLPLLSNALQAAKRVGIPSNRIYLISTPKEINLGVEPPSGMKSIDDLISMGNALPELPALNWKQGENIRRIAFLCYSSGTSGLPKGVQISHHNVIAAVMQKSIFDQPWKEKQGDSGTNVTLGLLPMNHIYALLVVCHVCAYVGDQVIVLPKFEIKSFLSSIARFKIEELYLVPPIIIFIVKNPDVLKKYDLSSVKSIFFGAAPTGKETMADLEKVFPHWIQTQAYGITETTALVTVTAKDDVWPGSVGSLLPGYEARVVTPDGKDVTTYDTPGELWVKSPSVTVGYLGRPEATKEAYVEDDQGRWSRTGDEVEIRKNPATGYEHIWIVDRIKELIKVNALQVAPAELESHLLTHEAVADCAVIAIPDDDSGERPKAFIVRSKFVGIEDHPRMLKRSIMRHVERSKAKYKWLKEVEFIDVVPKSASGKILRRVLREREMEKRRGEGAKL